MSLKEYHKKRNFRKTPEPRGGTRRDRKGGYSFVVQKHDASRLHYDFRLEMDGVLKSWAVPKGPSIDASAKRLAVHVEDHPIDYGGFEGTIPEHEYGGGTVMLWDRGAWHPHDDPAEAYRKGHLSFDLEGEKLRGAWSLVRMHGEGGDDGKNWLLIKAGDKFASGKAKDDPLRRQPDSVATGRSLEEIGKAESNGEGRGFEHAKSAKSKSKTRQAVGRTAPKPKLGKTIEELAPRDDDSMTLDQLPRITGVKKGSPPRNLRPQLATLAGDVPRGSQWLYEIKFDGYRILAFAKDGHWRLMTRNGKDWTARFATIAASLGRMPLKNGVLDGEVVVLKANGVSDFQALQNALRRDQREHMHYYVFDLPYCDGYDLTGAAQIDRKRILRGLLPGSDESASQIHFSKFVIGDGEQLFKHACRFALEGLVAKRVDANYVSKRSKSWLKIRCGNRQEFVIIGYTDSKGSRKGFGALLLGVYEGKTPRYSGKVGTGFDEATLEDLYKRLTRRKVKTAPAADVPAGDARGAHWVKPELVAEIEFTEWTADDRLRHPVFHGLREDKPARQIKREQPSSSVTGNDTSRPSKADAEPKRRVKRTTQRTAKGVRPAKRKDEMRIAGVTLSNPDKVLYPEQHITKQALAEYYESVADWILPFVAKRPLSIVRCPSGRQKNCFYQKHADSSMNPSIRAVMIPEKQGQGDYLYIKDVAGLIALVQLGVLEIHPWGSRVDRVDKPDVMVFDLDPDSGVPFADTMAAAELVRDRLAEYELESFLKTTGGKGLHVVAPLQRRNTWEDVRGFSEAVARAIVKADPDHFVANMRKDKRKNKVFVDYLRNARGATSVAPYSTRARVGAPVSAPLGWDELDEKLTPDAYTLANLPHRLAKLKVDPWKGFDRVRQSITKTMLRDAK